MATIYSTNKSIRQTKTHAKIQLERDALRETQFKARAVVDVVKGRECGRRRSGGQAGHQITRVVGEQQHLQRQAHERGHSAGPTGQGRPSAWSCVHNILHY